MTEPKKPPTSNQPKKQMRSVEASRAIWQTQANLTTSELLLLQALGSHADEHFECYPSTGRLATMTRLSKRQVIRILRALRTKGLLAFEENRGGRKKCNHYRLLIPAKGEKKGDTNGDIAKGDTPRNGDISNIETVTSCTQTVTNPHVNGDIAMSPEWVERFLEGVRTEGGEKPTPPLFENDDITPQEIDGNPDKFLETVFAEGIPVTRDQVCDFKDHGSFARPGWLWRNWLVWKGMGPGYGSWYSQDAGCRGCELRALEEAAKYRAKHSDNETALDLLQSWPVAFFELEGASVCPHHGPYICEVTVTEQSPRYLTVVGGGRYGVILEDCPDCEDEMCEEMEISHRLDLSANEWTRGREAIMAAVHYASGQIDGPTYLEELQDTVIPHVKEWQEEHPEVEAPRLPHSLM